MAQERVERKLAAILAADVVGYSRLVGSDEEGTIARLDALRKELIDPSIAKHQGRIVKTTGDGILIEFPSVVDAVRSAVEVQRAIAERNEAEPRDQLIEFRIGVNLGDIVVQGDDILGEGVNVAARLEGLAKPGGICIPRQVYQEVRNKLDVGYEFIGEQKVKNIEAPIPVYRVLLAPDAVGKVIGEGRFGRRHWHLGAVAAVTAVAVAFAVGWWRPWERAHDPLPDKPSIAVLPFDNLSDDKSQDYFAEGMAEDIITDLSRLAGLFVIARHSSFAYKGRQVDIRTMGRELGVRYLLEGSVRRAEDSVRINVQLVDAETGGHIWAQRYDGQLKDIFSLQDKVTQEIVLALAVSMSGQEQAQLSRLPTNNLEAYDYYLQAEQTAYSLEPLNMSKSLSLYERAVRLDPQFAEAHAGLARVAVNVWREGETFILPEPVARRRAYQSASRALELRPDLQRPYSVLGVLQMVQGKYDVAVASAQKAVDLAPSDADARMDLALVLAHNGTTAEAVRVAETALRLDPKPAPGFLLTFGLVLFLDRQYQRALEPLEMAWRAVPESPITSQYLAMVYAQLGRQAEAEAKTKEFLSFFPADGLAHYRIVYAYHRRKEDLDHRIEAMRMAGLPEWPYGFVGRHEDQVDHNEIKAMVFGRTWQGHTGTKERFVQEFGKDGSFAIYTGSRLNTGIAKVRDGLLCLSGVYRGQDTCGSVYRNPEGSPERRNEYIYVIPNRLFNFSVVK